MFRNPLIAGHTILVFLCRKALPEPVRVVHREVRILLSKTNRSGVPRLDPTVAGGLP